jgi:hypothetical protein
MNETEQKMHQELFDEYIALGYSVAEAFAEATAWVRSIQGLTVIDYSDVDIYHA